MVVAGLLNRLFAKGHGADEWKKLFGPDWFRAVLTAESEVNKRVYSVRDVAMRILRETDEDALQNLQR